MGVAVSAQYSLTKTFNDCHACFEDCISFFVLGCVMAPSLLVRQDPLLRVTVSLVATTSPEDLPQTASSRLGLGLGV